MPKVNCCKAELSAIKLPLNCGGTAEVTMAWTGIMRPPEPTNNKDVKRMYIKIDVAGTEVMQYKGMMATMLNIKNTLYRPYLSASLPTKGELTTDNTPPTK